MEFPSGIWGLPGWVWLKMRPCLVFVFENSVHVRPRGYVFGPGNRGAAQQISNPSGSWSPVS